MADFKVRVFMTHDGLMTVKSMRYAIARASGDHGWRDSEWHSDEDVIRKYDELGNDPGKNKYGFVEEI